MTFLALSAFGLTVCLGHVYCSLLVLVLTSIMYKEVISLKRKDEKDKKNPLSWIDWYYFGVFTFSVLPWFIKGQSTTGAKVETFFYEYH